MCCFNHSPVKAEYFLTRDEAIFGWKILRVTDDGFHSLCRGNLWVNGRMKSGNRLRPPEHFKPTLGIYAWKHHASAQPPWIRGRERKVKVALWGHVIEYKKTASVPAGFRAARAGIVEVK